MKQTALNAWVHQETQPWTPYGQLMFTIGPKRTPSKFHEIRILILDAGPGGPAAPRGALAVNARRPARDATG